MRRLSLVGLLLSAVAWAGAGKHVAIHKGAASTVRLPALSILPNGPVAPQLAAGVLTTQSGVSVTDTRASSVYCADASGVLHLLSNNQPCTEASGLRAEGQATNLILQSQTLCSTPWSFGNGETCTTGAGIAPDGTNTMVKVANGGTSYAGFGQSVTLAANTQYSTSFWVRGTATSTRMDFGAFDNTASAFLSVSNIRALSGPGSFSGTALLTVTGLSSSQPTRVCYTYTTGANTNINPVNAYADAQASTTSGAADLVWGFQTEAGSQCTSYIPTTTTAVTRAADSHDSGALVLTSASTFSLSYDVTPQQATPGQTSTITDSDNGAGDQLYSALLVTGAVRCAYYNGTTTISADSTATLTTGVKGHVRCYADGSKIYSCVNGSCVGSASAPTLLSLARAHQYIGYDTNTGLPSANVEVVALCFDSPMSRCQ